MRDVVLAAIEAARERAELLSDFGAQSEARATRAAADLIEEHYKKALYAPVSLEQAALESGYSAEHLARLVREGTLPNAGASNSPLIRRSDLPRKPGHGVASGSPTEDQLGSKMQMARSVVDSD